MDNDKRLFAIFRHGEAEPIWSAVTEQAEAERVAVVAAVNGGNCELLSGDDLALRLLGDVPRLSPVHPMGERWRPGERVELCSGGYGGRPKEYRPGTVARIDRTYGYRESLVVAFDDGETRAINPDVMRHRREEAKA